MYICHAQIYRAARTPLSSGWVAALKYRAAVDPCGCKPMLVVRLLVVDGAVFSTLRMQINVTGRERRRVWQVANV